MSGKKMRGQEGIRLEASRFLVAGLCNTALTLAVYQIALYNFSQQVSYAVSWLCGLAFVVAVYPSRVFGNRAPTARSLVGFAICYFSIFIVGLAAIKLLSCTNLPPRTVIVPVLAITTSANFLIGRIVLGAKA